MTMLRQIREEAKPTLALACPLVAGQVSHMLTGLADTVMIGRLGATPLAASALANSLIHLPLVFGVGMATAVSIQVSQARGAEDPAWARTSLRHGLYLAGAMGVASLIFGGALIPSLPWLKQVPEVIEAAPVYLMLISFSMLPAFGSMMIKSHADSMNRPWTPFWILMGGVLLNVFFNWLLIFGALGFPAWGLEGAGVATVLARTCTLIGLTLWCRSDVRLREWVPRRWFTKPDWVELHALWKLGLPTSLQIVAEMTAMIAATLIIGSLGALALAAHQVAMTCAATVFMVPLGLSQALTVRIGEARGAKRPERMRPILIGGWLIGIVFTVFSASTFLGFNETMAGWFLADSPAAAVAAGLLSVAAVFQLADALQITSVGALRGLSDVRYPAWLSFLICWFVSLPIGWTLAYPLGQGVTGIWWGFTIGLTTMAIAFGIRAWGKTRPDKVDVVKVSTTMVDEPILGK